MDPLLIGSEEKYPLNHRQSLAGGNAGGKGVAVSGLALAGKGPHQVLTGLALGKFNHGRGLLFLISDPVSPFSALSIPRREDFAKPAAFPCLFRAVLV